MKACAVFVELPKVQMNDQVLKLLKLYFQQPISISCFFAEPTSHIAPQNSQMASAI
jgi:hypothetical protein